MFTQISKPWLNLTDGLMRSNFSHYRSKYNFLFTFLNCKLILDSNSPTTRAWSFMFVLEFAVIWINQKLLFWNKNEYSSMPHGAHRTMKTSRGQWSTTEVNLELKKKLRLVDTNQCYMRLICKDLERWGQLAAKETNS